MSYSRWSNSRWYTFHHTESGLTYDDQIFAIYDAGNGLHHFTTKELDGITLDELYELIKSNTKDEVFHATGEEMNELLGYINMWLCDMREEFDKEKS